MTQKIGYHLWMIPFISIHTVVTSYIEWLFKSYLAKKVSFQSKNISGPLQIEKKKNISTKRPPKVLLKRTNLPPKAILSKYLYLRTVHYDNGGDSRSVTGNGSKPFSKGDIWCPPSTS